MTVSPERFETQMDVLSSSFRPMPLGELVAARADGLPPGAVAVSFDDGYADNLRAVPSLERHGVPATVFVATGFVGGARPFWWEELLALAPDGELDRLQEKLRALPPDQLERSLSELRGRADASGRAAAPDRRPLDRGELERLAASELVEIGAHTRNHPSLAGMPGGVLGEEIEGSRSDLAEWLGAPPALFSYPFGMHGTTVRRAAREAGFEAAFGTYPAPITWLTDRFELGRLWVEDVSAEELERQLRGLGING